MPTIPAQGSLGATAQLRQSSDEEFDVNQDNEDDVVNEEDSYEYESSSSGHVLRFSHELMQKTRDSSADTVAITEAAANLTFNWECSNIGKIAEKER